MKSLKSKLVASIALVGIFFALFSFNTVPVEARETVSKVNFTPLFFQDLPASSLREADAEAAAAAAAAAVAAARRLAEAVLAGMLANALGRAFAEVPVEEQTFAPDALDKK